MSQIKNVLFITSDEMRYDASSLNGNPDCRTPHLEALGKRGVVFDNHFTVHGKCVPSRIAMQTGRYAHTEAIRTVNKDNLLPKGDPNLMEHLRGKGFETAVFGLNHVWHDEWFYGGNEKGGGAVDYHSFTTGYFDDLAMRKVPVPDRQTPVPACAKELETIDYSGCKEGSVENFSDLNRTEQAVKYLTEVRDRSKPFYLQVNLSKPHPPYGIHEPYYSMYDRDAITAYPHELPENATLHLRKQRELRLGNDISEAALRELQAVYYGSVTFIDDCIKRIMEAMESEDLFKDTLIIFCADHGDFASQYGINEKWDTAMQDCILHVPFILAAPGLPAGTRIDSLTEHVDIPETVLELLGIDGDERWHWHGRSLLRAIEGERKAAVFADGGHEAPMRARFDCPAFADKNGLQIKTTGGKQLVYRDFPDAMARVKMVRSEDWKLAIRETGGNELFDLKNDPNELVNVYGDAAYNDVVMDLQHQMIQWCLRTDTDRPYQENVGA